MNNPNAKRFIKKRRNSNARKLFIKVLGYFVFCYEQVISEEKQYSYTYISKKTSSTVEDFLKKRFVFDYLRKRKLQLTYQNQLSQNLGRNTTEIETLYFYPEPEAEYTQNDLLKSDKIDVLVTNLPLKDDWSDVEKEDLYFVFEYKRLLNKTKNASYITDTQKFVDRKYTFFRFPFNGMVGIIEKSKIPVLDIIEDIETKLKNSTTIKSIESDGKILSPFIIPSTTFNYCRLATHYHNNNQGKIEVFHLFFDYSKILID